MIFLVSEKSDARSVLDSEAARDLYEQKKGGKYEMGNKFDSSRPTVKNNLFKEFEVAEDNQNLRRTFNKENNFQRSNLQGLGLVPKDLPFYSPNKVNLIGYAKKKSLKNYDLKEASLRDSSILNKESLMDDFEYSKEEDIGESRLGKSSYKGKACV